MLNIVCHQGTANYNAIPHTPAGMAEIPQTSEDVGQQGLSLSAAENTKQYGWESLEVSL